MIKKIGINACNGNVIESDENGKMINIYVITGSANLITEISPKQTSCIC